MGPEMPLMIPPHAPSLLLPSPLPPSFARISQKTPPPPSSFVERRVRSEGSDLNAREICISQKEEEEGGAEPRLPPPLPGALSKG